MDDRERLEGLVKRRDGAIERNLRLSAHILKQGLADALARADELEARAEKAEAEAKNTRTLYDALLDERARSFAMLATVVGKVGCTEYQAEVDLEIASRIEAIKAEVERLKKQLCPPVRHARRIEFWAVPERPHVVCMSDEDFMAWGRERAQLERLKARLGLWTKTGEYIQTVIRLLFTNQPMGPNRREMLTEWAEMIEHALRDTESG